MNPGKSAAKITHRKDLTGIPNLLRLLMLGSGALMASDTTVQEQPLDHSCYDEWRSISDKRISRNGDWVSYELKPGDPEAGKSLELRRSDGTQSVSIENGFTARFTFDSGAMIYLTRPSGRELKEKRRELKKRKEKDIDRKMPKARLEIRHLESGAIKTYDRVRSFKMPRKSSRGIAFLHYENLNEEQESEEEKKKEEKEKEKEAGTTLIIQDWESGKDHRADNVTEYRFTDNGRYVFYATSTEAGDQDGAHLYNLETHEVLTLKSGKGRYFHLEADRSGMHFAFLSDQETYDADQPEPRLYYWTPGFVPPMSQALEIAKQNVPGIPENWWISEHRELSFSENSKRLFFGTCPRPEKTEKEEDGDEEEKVAVDIWHWKDSRIQPHQLKKKKDDLEKSYEAVFHIEDYEIVQLETPVVPIIRVSSKGDAVHALGLSRAPYEALLSWDYPEYLDVYRVNTRTGNRERILEKLQCSAGRISLSPEGKYITWWDGAIGHQRVYSMDSRKMVNLTREIPYPVKNELNDRPRMPSPYGSPVWLDEDKGLIVYDQYDAWLVNPEGFWPPVCMTDGFGRRNHITFRYLRLDPDKKSIAIDEEILLSAFDEDDKSSGFYMDKPRGKTPPKKLIHLDESISGLEKSRDADQVILTRETFELFPDIWTCDMDFNSLRRLSDANPQQSKYSWGTARLVKWTSLDGEILSGILYQPDRFDPSRKYPMMTYFYERNSDRLHRHHAPEPNRSSINISFYTSRGYLVFVPDIPYRIGYPGESAVNAILPGVMHLIEKGFVDRARIGIQGHSWGGYQTAFLITRSRLFAAAEAGAPVSNMTSAYGGVRWGTGLSRMFQYEKTQSRIDGTLWNAQHRYIENSPLFWADKIETPLLMMHNDRDGAVPWYQGIELFLALRRLDRPVWLINYNRQDHGLTRWIDKKDWAIRMQQFFDHYLKEAPAPQWLLEGIPALEKGKTLGLEFPQTRAEP